LKHPQVVARKSFVDIDHPKVGKVPVVNVPGALSRTPGAVRSPCPRWASNGTGLAGVAWPWDTAAIAKLRGAGALGAPAEPQRTR
jgi:crotonobetainyl-CoA:carnitine CoA-transferase CaiB-like acyl-CoA transferase